MVKRHSSKPDPPLGEECRVASLQSRELQNQDYACYLSAEERTKYMALPSLTRKSEWLAGRLAAKYIFLNRAGNRARAASCGLEAHAHEPFPRRPRPLSVMDVSASRGGD